MSGFDNEILFADGAEIGPDAKDTSSSTRISSIIKNQNDTTNTNVVNTTNDTNASAQAKVTSADSGGGIAAFPTNHTTIPTLAGHFALLADTDSTALTLRATSGQNIEFHNGSSILGTLSDIGELTLPLIPLGVPSGGSGRTDSTAYSVICGGTDSTQPHQSVASVGTAGQVLTSNGSSVLPSFQNGAITGKLGAVNLSMTYSAGTVTIRGADGNDLSATNPAYITLPSNANSDQLVTVSLTSNKTFDDSAGTSVFAGSLFGMDTGDDSTGQSRPIPFWIYPILDDNDANPIFAVSRVPHIKITTNTNGTGGINNATGGGADNAMELLALESITVGNYDANFTTAIGSLDLEINGSDDWTVVDVDSDEVGIGKLDILVRNFPFGLNGAAASSYFKANGGTAPTVNNNDQFPYKIMRDGTVHWEMSFRLGGSPAGAVDALLTTPIKGETGTTFQQLGTWTDGSDAKTTFPISFYRENASDTMELRKADGTSGMWQYEEFSLDDVIRVSLTWQL